MKTPVMRFNRLLYKCPPDMNEQCIKPYPIQSKMFEYYSLFLLKMDFLEHSVGRYDFIPNMSSTESSNDS